MSYLHCHKCGWEQDDFWSFELRWSTRPFGYNPLSCIIESVYWLIRPRYIGMDKWIIDDINSRFVRVRIRDKINDFTNNIEMTEIYEIHSWALLWWEIKKNIRKFRNMKWWTYRAYKYDKYLQIAECPKCKSKTDFDMD